MTPPGPAARSERRNRNPVVAVCALVAILGAGVILALAGGLLRLDGHQLAAHVRDLGPWGPAAVIGLMVVHNFVPFPAELLALGAGAVFGAVWGTVLVWIGAMLGAALAFALARWLGRDFVEASLSAANRARLDAFTSERGAAALLISRLIPLIAFNLINYAAGLTRVGWWTFLWTTAVGILPLTALTAYLGSAMADLTWPWIVTVSAVGIGTITIAHLWLRRRAGATPER